ncbi:MAG TPA: LysR family transcriptional regulator [Gammaproteobacteria bacterium]
MDIELLRTFVEVYRCRHFGKAADRLYITQSAVSARIRQLETSLGCQLLVRERKQVQPTADGERFLRHAEALLKQWERARRDMTESAAGGPPLRIGAVPALWAARGMRWLAAYRTTTGASRVRTEAREAEQLMPRLVEGSLDLVLQFELSRAADVEHRRVGEVHLVLAASRPALDFAKVLQDSYLEMEWGGSFDVAQAEFMEGKAAGVRMDSVYNALDWLRENAGAAYVPEDVLRNYEYLHPVANAPRFAREVHAVWSTRGERREAIEAFLAVTQD